MIPSEIQKTKIRKEEFIFYIIHCQFCFVTIVKLTNINLKGPQILSIGFCRFFKSYSDNRIYYLMKYFYCFQLQLCTSKLVVKKIDGYLSVFVPSIFYKKKKEELTNKVNFPSIFELTPSVDFQNFCLVVLKATSFDPNQTL